MSLCHRGESVRLLIVRDRPALPPSSASESPQFLGTVRGL